VECLLKFKFRFEWRDFNNPALEGPRAGSLYRSAAGEKIEDKNDDGEDKEEMYPTAHGVAANESDGPKNDQNDGDGPKHLLSPVSPGN
jgi:hypothetical protein